MVVNLQDGQAGTITQLNGGVGGQTRGLRFTITADTQLTGMAWWRHAVGADVAPSRITLFREDGVPLVESLVPPDDNTVGWQWLVFNDPIDAFAGDQFRVTACWAYPAQYSRRTAAPQPASAPFSIPANWNCIGTTGTCAFPTTTDQAQVMQLNVSAEGTPVGGGTGGGATPGEVNAALAAWLHPTLATEPEAPADTAYIPEALALIKSKLLSDGVTVDVKLGAVQNYPLVGLKNVAEGALLIYNVVKAIQDIFGTPNGPETDNAAQSRYLTLGAYMADTLHADHTAILAALQAPPNGLGDIVAMITSLQNQLQQLTFAWGSFPIGWQQTDETQFTNWIAWPVPAMLYVVHFDTIPGGWSQQQMGDLLWLPRAAWWATLNGTQPGERKFCDQQNQQLMMGGAYMPGVLLVPQPGFTGTIQSWIAP